MNIEMLVFADLPVRNYEPMNVTLSAFATKRFVCAAALVVLSGLGLCLGAAEAGKPVFVVTNGAFGAIADDVTDNAKALRAAIAAASAAGGGVVKIPAAAKAYASGPFKLANGVELQIESGATLAMLSYKVYPGTDDFITLAELHDVAISGGGVIDGRGAPWWKAFDDEKVKRPKTMIAVAKSERVRIEGITTLNPPNTHIQLRDATNVAIVGVTISSPEKSHNTDGIDISGRKILIDRCKISCGDDNIAIGGSSVANADIVVTNSEFGHGHGLSIGSYTSGGLRNLRVDQCTFSGTMAGIRMKTGRDRGGVVENLSYANLTMTDVEKPVYITSYYPDKTIPKDPASDTGAALSPKTPVWRNIVIRNVTARAAMDNSRCWNIIIWGVPEMPAGEIVLDNVSVMAPGALQLCNALVSFRGNVRLDAKGRPPVTTLYNSLLLIKQPRAQQIPAGGEAVFEIETLGGKGAEKTKPKIMWTHDGVTIADGRQPDGTEVAGATSERLILRHVQTAMAGKYQASVSAPLIGSTGSFLSDSVELAVVPR